MAGRSQVMAFGRLAGRWRQVTALIFSACAFGALAPAASAAESASDAQRVVDRMGAEPWRYGGASPDGRARVVVGLRRDGEDGVVGEYAVLDRRLRPLAYGSVTGSFEMPSAAGLSVSCRMVVTLPDRVLTLSGTCAPRSLSGSIEVRRTPKLLTQQVQNFVSPDMSVAQYWLTARGFQEAFSLSRGL
ncbi:hypothetical protein [Acetobacter nitrogenifigens]|nr:hypothetical protein [Acetobacter nitrogenifigens]